MLFAVVLAAIPHVSPTPAAPKVDLLPALRAHVKHVFVIYQENHSFDNYFGTFPGAENLESPEAQSHGFRQYDPIGKAWVTPFRITDPDTASPQQGRGIVFDKMNGGKMNAFVSTQEQVSRRKLDAAKSRDVGLLTMAHYDCETIPFLWKYASDFTLFDHIFSGMTGPSTPNAIALIAGQAGDVTNDLDPAYGPYSETDSKYQLAQRYATLMLALAGGDATQATNETQGVARDLGAVAASGRAAIPWGWYQEGYVSPTVALPGYETHHNPVQYFGYLRQNDVFWRNVHPVAALLPQLRDGTLPGRGIFYIKGGSRNGFGWKPANPDPVVQANYLGDDDHPGANDSDAHVGETFVATFVNAIARSKYWNDSVIIVTWDDPGGFYDHVPPPQFSSCPDGHPCGNGPRVPFLLISPYARSGAIVSDVGDEISILKFAEHLFDLPPLATLPDEAGKPVGPRDAAPETTDLLGAFDPARLAGTAPPILPSYADIPDAEVNTMPPSMNCRALGLAPVVLPNAPSTPPPNFHVRF
ncbi:MAG: phosphoesterase [Candidatus Eremiobacteraeota bacterium]|nr:phosphoesterase [Candidatus Eremiobacteraeota bacterium]